MKRIFGLAIVTLMFVAPVLADEGDLNGAGTQCYLGQGGAENDSIVGTADGQDVNMGKDVNIDMSKSK